MQAAMMSSGNSPAVRIAFLTEIGILYAVLQVGSL